MLSSTPRPKQSVHQNTYELGPWTEGEVTTSARDAGRVVVAAARLACSSYFPIWWALGHYRTDFNTFQFFTATQAFVFCGKPTRALSAPQSHEAPVRKAFLPTDKEKESRLQKEPSQQRKTEKMPRQQHGDIWTQNRKMSSPPGAVYSELSNVTRWHWVMLIQLWSPLFLLHGDILCFLAPISSPGNTYLGCFWWNKPLLFPIKSHTGSDGERKAKAYPQARCLDPNTCLKVFCTFQISYFISKSK